MDSEIIFGMFDVDGTVTKSASVMGTDMAELLGGIKQRLAFISGTDIDELHRMLAPLAKHKKEFYILPEMGAACYSSKVGRLYEYGEPFPWDLFAQIKLFASMSMADVGIIPIADDVFLKRRTQMTISLLGRSAPDEAKRKFDPRGSLRRKVIHDISQMLERNIEELPCFTLGGSSSIDIQTTDWDKEDGARTFMKFFGLKPENILFFGDNLQPGGNDFPITHTGIKCVPVSGPWDTLSRLAMLRKEAGK